MAADTEQETSTRAKRKRDHLNLRKLCEGQKVEVRNIEDGFLGSWHMATVVLRGRLMCHVRYDHLLCENGSTNLVECVPVSSAIDGFKPANWDPDNYRGAIRPFPPSLDVGGRTLHYGECVDLFFQDAWWEGVIFDHEDSSENRRIFFPDMGDEMTVCVNKLRITQDWDEFTEEWKPRGSWIFLELVEEVVQKLPLLVSVKQIWYEVREKNDCKDWTFSVRDHWRGLVSLVLSDNLKLTSTHFLSFLKSKQGFLQEGQSVDFSQLALNDKLEPQEFIDNSLPLDVPGCSAVVDNTLEEKNGHMDFALTMDDFLTSNKNLDTLIVQSPEEVLSMTPPNLSSLPHPTYEMLGMVVDNHEKVLCKSSIVSAHKIKHCGRNYKLMWSPVALESQPFFEAVAEFKSVSLLKRRPSADLNLRVRKHLLYLGWKIESVFDKCMTRFRYFSPSGKLFMSLVQICNNLETVSDTLSAGSLHDERTKPNWSPVSLEAKLFPEAVAEFKRLLLLNTWPNQHLLVEVMSHLLYLGWKIETLVENLVTKFRYFSPSGTSFRSLALIFKDSEMVSDITLSVVPLHDQRIADGLISSSPEFKPLECKDGLISSSPEFKPLKCKERSLLSIEDFIDPEYCLQAVVDYASVWPLLTLSQRKEKRVVKLADKAKKHLAFSYWKFYTLWKGDSKRGYRYISPDGKIFSSLVTACKWYAKENACSSSNVHLTGKSEFTYDVEDEKLPTPVSSGFSLSKDHVQPGHSGVSGYRTLRRKRKASSYASRDLIAEGDVAGSHSSSRVLRSYKRARQVAPSSSYHTPRSVLSWLIDNNVVLPRTKVQYRRRGDSHPRREGRLTRYGIKCNCCQEVYGLSSFGVHAGNTDHSPSTNIFLDDGRSILECQLEMKRVIYTKRKEQHIKKVSDTISKNDYICSICHDGGELILCDQCPSSYHTGCLGMKELPDGDWFCPFCCCGICGQSQFDKSKNPFTDNNAIYCCQCNHQYHVGCIRNNGLLKHDSDPEGYWFCNKRCEEIFLGLHKLLGKPIRLGTNNLSWTLLKYSKPDDSSHDAPDYELAIENYSKLNVALGVMHECFEPIKESRTGSDLMEDIVFSRRSELNRLNFQGFYTVVLERNDELITVATLRVHGEKVAEVPFVATRFQYRRLGMCRILMNVLEKKLTELRVERLVLPAATSVLDTWTRSFGFSVMEESERLNFLDFSILNFHGTVMCEKLLARTSKELIVVAESTQHTDKGNAELEGTSAVSEVVQAEQIDGSGIMHQGPVVGTRGGIRTSSDDSPAPLALVLDETAAPDFPIQMSYDYDYSSEALDQKGYENDDVCMMLKCYKRRRRDLPVEANLFMKQVKGG